MKLLEESHIDYERVEHEPVYTSEQAAAVRGFTLQQGAKSLLFKVGSGDFVLVVVPGDKRVDSRKLKKLLRVKDARFARPEEVQAQLGCEIGACYPLGKVAGLRTLCDLCVGRNETIAFNPGRHDVSIKLRYADYVRLARPEIVDIT
ncbi:MAG TPA: YbaK/EbsC family protein [Candidatus Saccharimonadales bacterium]|nr:YbaK/EbsC family protein [Candidatus Saccharimonadales bacterium]